MGIGHVAVGLGLTTADRSLNAGWLIFGALLSDFLLGWFVLAGWESYQFPPDFASTHYMLFTFPWSHGLLPDLLWGSVLGLLAWVFLKQTRAAFLVGIAVVSHFLLDGLVHVKGLPVAGPGSWELGVGLWRNLPVELTLEAVMAIVAITLYLRATRDRSRGRRIGMVVYVVVLGCLMIFGQVAGAEPPPRTALIVNWIALPPIFAAIAWAIDRHAAAERLF